MIPRPRCSPLFPYTTLFRSVFLERTASIGPHETAGSLHDRLAALGAAALVQVMDELAADRKSTRLNSSHRCISYAVFCLQKKHARRTRWTGTPSTGPDTSTH